jgi:tetratricopeptide (TPR) repeat protein
MKNVLTVLALSLASTSFANNNFTDSAEHYYSRGMAEKLANRNLVASQFFEKALDFNQKDAKIYVQAAQTFQDMRVLDKARKYYIIANDLDPNNATVIKELANLYYDYRQWDKAIEFASKCNTCENGDRILGMSYYKKEDYVNAEKYLLKAITKNANDAQAYYTMARNYVDAEQDRKALPYLEKAASLSPDKASWASELGMMYFNMRNYKGAVTAYENAIKAGITTNNDFNEEYAYALIYSGNYAKGEELILDIYKKKGNKEILREVAMSLYAVKQYERSLDYLSKLIEADPKDGKAMYQAGLTFIKLGKKDRGQAMCDKGIELDPSLASKKSAVGDMSGGL